MNRHLVLIAAACLSALAPLAQAADGGELALYRGKPLPSFHVTVASFEGEQVLQGEAASVPKPANSQIPSAVVGARAGTVAGQPDALTLHWKDAWFTSLRVDGGAPLDLRPYLAEGTVEFDINVIDLATGGIYVTMQCGADCTRKVPYVLPGRALQGKGWQHLSFALSCFARREDDFSKVPVPFTLDGSGAGEVALANITLKRRGTPNAACPDYRTVTFTPAPLSHAWALDWWMPRHEKKLDDIRALKEAGKSPQLVFIGDSITEGWEKSGLPVWQRYYAKYNPLDLGFGGDSTENVLWRLQHGEIDGIAPKVAVLMVGTNNGSHRSDAPQASADGVKHIIEELRRRLPNTKVLLLAIFPRDERPDGALRRLNARVNAIISAFADGQHVFFADLNAAFLDADGTLSREIMPDLLHPGEKGYAIWARSMEPSLRTLLGDEPNERQK